MAASFCLLQDSVNWIFPFRLLSSFDVDPSSSVFKLFIDKLVSKSKQQHLANQESANKERLTPSSIKNGFQLRSLLMFFWLVKNNQSNFDARLSINKYMTDELSLRLSIDYVLHLTSLIEKPRQFSPLFATDFAPEIYCNCLPPFRWKFRDYFKKCPKKQNTEGIK